MNIEELVDIRDLIKPLFIKVLNKALSDKTDDKYKEVEIRFLIDSLKLLNNFLKKSPTIDTYLELKSGANRLRIPYKEISLEHNDKVAYIVENAITQGYRSDEKMLVAEEKSQHFVVSYSHEKPAPFVSKKRDLSLVTRFSLTFENFVVEFKIKNMISRVGKTDSRLSQLLPNINNTYRMSLEIELLNLRKDPKILLKELNQILMLLFGKKAGNPIYLSNKPILPAISTFQMSFLNIKNFDPKTTLLTTKTDGEYVQFIVKDGYLYFYLPPLIHMYKINSKKNFAGHGEFLKPTREIYPFALHNTSMTREEQFDFFSDFDNGDSTIKLCLKPYWGPFESHQDIFFLIQERERSKVPEEKTDGYILIQNETKQIVDYKLKFQNTIDIFATLSWRGNSENGVDLQLWQSDGQTITKRCDIRTGADFSFDERSQTLQYFDSNENTMQVFPTMFIMEIDVTTNEYLPRIDKTEKFIQTGYKGNPKEIIQKIYQFATEGITRDFILNLTQDSLQKLFDKMSNNSLDKNKEYIQQPLNTSVDWYDTKKKKVALGPNLLMNAIKTQDFEANTSMTQNRIHKPSVLSIYCGRGGDLNKCFFIGAKYVFGLEPSTISIEEAIKRYQQRKESNPYVFDFKVLEGRLEERDIVERLLDAMKEYKFPKKYDHIDCHQGIHFSFTSKTKHHILHTINTFSKPGTNVFITTNNKSIILPELKAQEDKTIIMTFDNIDYRYTLINDEKISVMITPSMASENQEYLIDKDEIIEAFTSNGFAILQVESADNLLLPPEMYRHMAQCISKETESNSGAIWLSNLSKLNFNSNLKQLMSFQMNFGFTKL